MIDRTIADCIREITSELMGIPIEMVRNECLLVQHLYFDDSDESLDHKALANEIETALHNFIPQDSILLNGRILPNGQKIDITFGEVVSLIEDLTPIKVGRSNNALLRHPAPT